MSFNCEKQLRKELDETVDIIIELIPLSKKYESLESESKNLMAEKKKLETDFSNLKSIKEKYSELNLEDAESALNKRKKDIDDSIKSLSTKIYNIEKEIEEINKYVIAKRHSGLPTVNRLDVIAHNAGIMMVINIIKDYDLDLPREEWILKRYDISQSELKRIRERIQQESKKI